MKNQQRSGLSLNLSRLPTPEELYALELEARRLRSAELARLFSSLFR